MEKHNVEKDIAAFIKKDFDKKYNATWYVLVRWNRKILLIFDLLTGCFLFCRHCIVGRNFGSYVTHESKHFVYFYIGQIAVLLFKSGS